MIKRYILLIILLFIGTISCKKSHSKKQDDKTYRSSHDSILFNNYISSIENNSTIQYFTVIKIKDINTGNIREICTKGNFLWGALYYEYGKNYGKSEELKIHKLLIENKQRYFQLKDTTALNNLGMNRYSIADLKKFEKENNVDSIAKSIKGEWGMPFSDDKNMLLLAHSLFNRGILTGENNCFGGTLIHINKPKS